MGSLTWLWITSLAWAFALGVALASIALLFYGGCLSWSFF